MTQSGRSPQHRVGRKAHRDLAPSNPSAIDAAALTRYEAQLGPRGAYPTDPGLWTPALAALFLDAAKGALREIEVDRALAMRQAREGRRRFTGQKKALAGAIGTIDHAIADAKGFDVGRLVNARATIVEFMECCRILHFAVHEVKLPTGRPWPSNRPRGRITSLLAAIAVASGMPKSAALIYARDSFIDIA